MLLVQLCLAFLLGMLGPVASAASLRRTGGGWYAWSGVLLAGWVAGTSAILVQRFPDWAVLYLFEAKYHPLLIVLLGALLSAFVAWLGMRLVVPPLIRDRLPQALLRIALATFASVALLVLVRERLTVVATTFEFRQEQALPASRVVGFQGLLALVLIGVVIPSLGSLLLLLLDSLRRREPRPH
jgi:hypothetical protein